MWKQTCFWLTYFFTVLQVFIWTLFQPLFWHSHKNHCSQAFSKTFIWEFREFSILNFCTWLSKVFMVCWISSTPIQSSCQNWPFKFWCSFECECCFFCFILEIPRETWLGSYCYFRKQPHLLKSGKTYKPHPQSCRFPDSYGTLWAKRTEQNFWFFSLVNWKSKTPKFFKPFYQSPCLPN